MGEERAKPARPRKARSPRPRPKPKASRNFLEPGRTYRNLKARQISLLRDIDTLTGNIERARLFLAVGPGGDVFIFSHHTLGRIDRGHPAVALFRIVRVDVRGL